MKKIILTGLLSLFITSTGFTWDLTSPADDIYKYLIPREIRQLKADIQAFTDPALQITDEKVSATANILDTKLHQITTANKVHGSALTGLASLTSGAGVIPAANLPTDNVKLTGTQTVAGVKTFSDSPIFPSPTTDYQPLILKYFNDNAVVLTGNQTIAGVKTFSSSPIVPTPTTDYQAATMKFVLDNKTTFGSWVDKSASYGAQQAATDGFVMAFKTTGQFTSGGYVRIKTDASNPPTTIRAIEDTGSDTTAIRGCVISPVKKGDYWLVETNQTITVYWISLGN